MERVVCVKVKNIHPHYQNLKEWMDDPQNLYIGRRGIVFIDNIRFPKKDSKWANPFRIGKNGTREDVLKKYEIYVTSLISDKKLYIEEIRGKTLGCWCHPEPCHGDILIKILHNL